MRDVVVVMAKRTAVAKQGGALREMNPEHLAASVLQSLLHETHISSELVDQVILGNVVGPGGNIARLSLLTAGFPITKPGVTVDLQCGSGLQAIHFGANEILVGNAEIVIAGGVESSSRAPWKIEKPIQLYGTKVPQFFNRARFSPDDVGDPEMGIAAENVAAKYGVSREEQDEFAFRSHQKAVAAQENGIFLQEIVPVLLRDKSQFVRDEGPRPNTSLEKLAQLNPVFTENGTVTAGNACSINDGAAAVLLMTSEKAEMLGLCPVLKYVSSALVGVHPNYLGIGPVPAVQKILSKDGLKIDDIDLFELNEAFASQVVGSVKELGIPMDRLNVNGGAIALGHPYGASGAILVTRMFYELNRRGGRRGITTMGIGGGLGIATLWERVNRP